MDQFLIFDICSLILLSVITLSTFFRKMTKGIASRLFISLVGTAVLTAILSILCTLLDNLPGFDSAILYTIHMLYLLFHNMSSPVYLMYIISLADTWHKFRKNKIHLILLLLPYIILIIMLFTNAYDHNIMAIENGLYVHKALFNTVYVVSGFYLAFAVLYLLINHRLFSKVKIISLISLVGFMVIALIVQFILPHYTVEMFAMALSLLIITMTTQRPEEVMDARTQLGNYNAYAENIKRSFETDKHFTVILLNIGNFPSIQSMLTYDSTVRLLRNVAKQIESAVSARKINADVYYLDQGRYRVVASSRHFVSMTRIAESITLSLQNDIDINSLSIGLDSYVCVANCPEDIKSFTAITTFGRTYQDRFPSDEKVILASELLKQKNFEMESNIDLIIDRAIKNNSFRVYYQPIFSVEKKRFTTAEALLRLIDDEYGFVPPDMFIPAAEKNGAINKIGDFVLDDVCRFIASDSYKNSGLEYIEINLSVAQCMHSDLAEKVLDAITCHNISTDSINLEITETAVSISQNIMKYNLNKLNKTGVTFSLDDYGTGYSNIKRVIQLPVKIVKLDKSFADEISNPKMWTVLRYTIKMLKDMNMEIVVEGIETEEMAEKFTELGCDYIQGYYYSKPIPEKDFIKFLHESH